jgi:hypothetical protein
MFQTDVIDMGVFQNMRENRLKDGLELAARKGLTWKDLEALGAALPQGVAAVCEVPDVLLMLSSSSVQKVREAVAKNISAPAAAFRNLMSDPISPVRWKLAGNPSIPEDVMQMLALDCDVDIRMMLSHNPSLPGEVCSILLTDLV